MPRATGPTWQPTAADYRRVIQEQNPWQETSKVPEAWAMKVERPLSRYLDRRLEDPRLHRFELILGPRRVGKTTAMYQTVKRLLGAGVDAGRLWWFRLDHPLLMNIPLNELIRLALPTADGTPRTGQPVYVFLDELAYAKNWDLWLKTFYDDKWPLRLVGTSSSTAAVKNRMLESGVGRWEEQYLAPYTFAEYLDLIGNTTKVAAQSTLWETLRAALNSGTRAIGLETHRRRFLLTGGFPELLNLSTNTSADEQTLLLESQKVLRADAVERAIYKDIPQTFGIGDTMLLERLLYTLAGQFCGVMSPTNICQNLDGMGRQTLERYISYLERAFLVFTLLNYSGSELSKQKRGRKLYFVDGAVRNAALQRGIGPLNDTDEMGLLMENMVAGHLHALGQQSGARLYYWRDGDDAIDLIYDHPDQPVAFEIASSPSHHRRGLTAFIKRFPRYSGRCFLVAPGAVPLLPGTDGIGTLPLDLLLLAIGAQTERELAARLGAGSVQ